MAASVSPTILIVSRDPEVKQVAAALQADGLTARTVGAPRELQRALNTKARCVAILDSELLSDESLATSESFEKLKSLPSLLLVAPDAELFRETSADAARR